MKEKTFDILAISGAIITTILIVILFASQMLILQSIGIMLVYSMLTTVWVIDDITKDSEIKKLLSIIGGVILFGILLVYNLSKFIVL